MTINHFLCATLTLIPCLLLAGCDRPSAEATASSSQSEQRANESALDATPTDSQQSKVVEATFDDLKFEMEKTDPFDRSLLTPKVEELFGRRIRIRGYMYPTLKKQGLTQFVLVRDNMECCFGPGAALYDCILVHMQPGKTATYSIRPIAVVGTLKFEEVIGPDGDHLAIYRLDGEKVE